MRLWPALFAFALLASGCTSSIQTDSTSHVTCVNGVCEVCVDGQCAPCDADACDACRDGDCPEFAQASEAQPPAPIPDVSFQETHDLLEGLQETSWRFDVAPGATGHAYLTIADSLTGTMTLSGELCVKYRRDFPNGYSMGGRGSCSQGNVVGISGSTTDFPLRVLDWDSLEPGSYTITASAPRQINTLTVDIVADNP